MRALLLCVVAAAFRAPRVARDDGRLRSTQGGDDAAAMWAEAARLRREIAEAEDAMPTPVRPAEDVAAAAAKSPGLSVVLPIARPDWTVEDTECFFEPRTTGDASLLAVGVDVPCGILFEERDDATGAPIIARCGVDDYTQIGQVRAPPRGGREDFIYSRNETFRSAPLARRGRDAPPRP